MADSLFIAGRLHAPYFIFLRCAGKYADGELLELFGLPKYRRTKSLPPFGPYTIIADDGLWTMVVDDWRYTLWHMPSTRPAIERLSQTCDVFACSVGDCDHSFDFIYYRDTRLVRKYVVADPDFLGGKVVENRGDPLPGEATAFKEHAGETGIVLAIAASLGIKTDYKEDEIRLYAPRK